MQPVGIEPTSTALQAAAMTTSAKVAYLVPRWRIELPYAPCKDAVLPLNYRGKLVAGLGFEPRMAKAYETSLVTGPSPR